MREIRPIHDNKKRYLDLLLLADPSEAMVDRYLDAGELFVLYEDGEPACQAVVLPLDRDACELKNLATAEAHQHKGCAGELIRWLQAHYRGRFRMMLVGTGEDNGGFYEQFGFSYSHMVKDFFVDNYPEPIYEDGKCLRDMLYLSVML